jgi:hypothetical protein
VYAALAPAAQRFVAVHSTGDAVPPLIAWPSSPRHAR